MQGAGQPLEGLKERKSDFPRVQIARKNCRNPDRFIDFQKAVLGVDLRAEEMLVGVSGAESAGKAAEEVAAKPDDESI